jgi:hypothetical protein
MHGLGRLGLARGQKVADSGCVCLFEQISEREIRRQALRVIQEGREDSGRCRDALICVEHDGTAGQCIEQSTEIDGTLRRGVDTRGVLLGRLKSVHAR